jgi:hypothetical protein
MRSVEPSRRASIYGALLLAGMFAAGAVFGVGVARWSAAPAAPDRGVRPPPPGGPVEAMIHELGLDADQIATLRSIEVKHRPQLDAIVRETVPRVRDVLFSIEEELRPSLRPDQIEKLAAWRARRPPPPMPGLGPPPGGPPGEPPPGGPPPP